MTMLRLEARIFRPLLKEILVCGIEIPKSLLKCHTVRFFQPAVFLVSFQIRKQSGGLDIAERLAVRHPLVTPKREKMIVHESAATQCSVDQILLHLVRIYSELEAHLI